MQSIKDWLFKTKEGKYVISQRPNLVAIVTMLALLGTFLTKSPIPLYIVFVAATLWSISEIFNGVNNFRRLLGLASIIYVAYWILT